MMEWTKVSIHVMRWSFTKNNAETFKMYFIEIIRLIGIILYGKINSPEKMILHSKNTKRYWNLMSHLHTTAIIIKTEYKVLLHVLKKIIYPKFSKIPNGCVPHWW